VLDLQSMSGVVIGSYRLLEKVGEGGMGIVWTAEHTLLGRRAAIKLLHQTFSNNEPIVQRFFNEAKVVATIADPGIVQIFDFGIHSDGSPYIVMELLDGEALDARLRRLRGLPPADALRFVKQVAISLQAAHDKGVIHRDLKPGNLFVARDPAIPGGERVKVLDFGIAKLNHGGGEHRTKTGTVIGTPAYMSPEQCRGLASIDHRSDIYSLGAVLFRLVTGRMPFRGEGEGDVIIAHVRERPPVPSSIARGVPARLDALILRCLEKDPALRYQTMAELAAALDDVEARPGEHAAPARLGPRQTTLGAPVAGTLPPHGITTMSDAPGEVSLGRRSAPRRWMSLALAASAASVVAVVLASGGSGGSGEEATSPGAAPIGPPAAAALADAPAETGPDRAAAPDTDASISIEVKPVAAPADAAEAPRPDRAPGTRNNHRARGRGTGHGSDTKASPDNPDDVDRIDRIDRSD